MLRTSDCREGRKETFIRKPIPKQYRWRGPREIQTFGEVDPRRRRWSISLTFSTVRETANRKILSNLSPALSLPDRQTSQMREILISTR
jgi:hypothetical protein